MYYILFWPKEFLSLGVKFSPEGWVHTHANKSKLGPVWACLYLSFIMTCGLFLSSDLTHVTAYPPVTQSRYSCTTGPALECVIALKVHDMC